MIKLVLELGSFFFCIFSEKKVVLKFSAYDLDEEQISRESQSLGLHVACVLLPYPSHGVTHKHLSVVTPFENLFFCGVVF